MCSRPWKMGSVSPWPGVVPALRRTLSQEARSEGLTQGTLPVGIGPRTGGGAAMKRSDRGDDVRVDRMHRGRPGSRDSDSRHHEFGDRFHSLFLSVNTELGLRG
jgi:hypothetical protein